jgi:hypothetical protein
MRIDEDEGVGPWEREEQVKVKVRVALGGSELAGNTKLTVALAELSRNVVRGATRDNLFRSS